MNRTFKLNACLQAMFIGTSVSLWILLNIRKSTLYCTIHINTIISQYSLAPF